MDVLIHISQQLSNSTISAFEPAAFQVSYSAAAVNILFFLSLALVLIDAFLAMLVKGWLQEFDRGWRKYTVAHLRAQERERRLQELEHWKLHELVALLPILIQGSLLLFCIGLIVLIFPLHLPSAILFTVTFVCGVGFYGFTTYVSIVNDYAPFSSPVSRLLARGLAILQARHFPIPHSTWNITSAIPFLNRPPLFPHDRQSDAGTSQEITRPLPSNNGEAKPAEPPKFVGVVKGKMVSRSRSDIDPKTHIHVLERVVATTAEAVENIPIFLELLDQPVKNVTLRPFNMEKWKELLHVTLGLLRDQSTFSVSAAWTLTRTMMMCYNYATADRQLCLTLQHRLDSRETDETGPRMPLNLLFPSYLSFWLGTRRDMWQIIALLEPSDAADAELLWMVNTFHRTRMFKDWYPEFFVAVLTYVSSTEQSRRSRVPLTAAVVYAMHTIRSALDQGNIGTIDRPYILPGNVATFEPAPMMFCQVDGIDVLDLWSGDCIRFVKDLLQWYQGNDFQLPLIVALYIDSTKHAHARSTFEDLLRHTRITNIQLGFSDAYDHGKLAVYWYMAVTQQPLDQDGHPFSGVFNVIRETTSRRARQWLSGLRIMEIAVLHVHATVPPVSNWLRKERYGLRITAPGEQYGKSQDVDNWFLLHLDTLLATQLYLPPEEVKDLRWFDTPEQVHIAKARLDLYDSLAKAGHQGANGPRPEPELLRMFLRSKDYEVCTRAFKWCLDLFATPGDTSSTRVFIPETMGHEHFVSVICKGHYWERRASWEFLLLNLVPKWTMLPSSWRHEFASALLFSILRLLDTRGLSASIPLAENFWFMFYDPGLDALLSFLTTLLELIQSSLTSEKLTTIEYWWTQTPEKLKTEDIRTRMELILATRRQELEEEDSSQW